MKNIWSWKIINKKYGFNIQRLKNDDHCKIFNNMLNGMLYYHNKGHWIDNEWGARMLSRIKKVHVYGITF